MPAQAGIHEITQDGRAELDSRLRGNDSAAFRECE
jgi:hypothetical protein